MSLTNSDLQRVRQVVIEAVQPLENEVKALRNDIKELYEMVADIEKQISQGQDHDNMSLEEKILDLNSKLVRAAKQAGITLPR